MSESVRIPTPGSIELHTLRWGNPSRPTLVMLHGGGANAHWWDHMAPRFADRFHVVALDFRGHGDSDHPEERTQGAFNDDLVALLEHLGTPEVFLLGHSMGGHVALDHAAHHSAVRASVVLDAARGATSRSNRATRLALTFRRTYRTREEAEARYRFYPPAERADEALRAEIAKHSVQVEPDGRYGYKFDPRWFQVPPRPKPDLGGVSAPVLLLRGAESTLLTAEGAREMAEELPDAQLAVVEDAGHHVQIDQPEATLALIEGFLAERL